jgi:hypothetical protein
VRESLSALDPIEMIRTVAAMIQSEPMANVAAMPIFSRNGTRSVQMSCRGRIITDEYQRGCLGLSCFPTGSYP